MFVDNFGPMNTVIIATYLKYTSQHPFVIRCCFICANALNTPSAPRNFSIFKVEQFLSVIKCYSRIDCDNIKIVVTFPYCIRNSMLFLSDETEEVQSIMTNMILYTIVARLVP